MQHEGKARRGLRGERRLNQYLARLGKELVNFPFDASVDHLLRAAAIRAGKLRRGAEQPADQRALGINLAPINTKMRAAQCRQRQVMFRVTFNGQSRHLFG